MPTISLRITEEELNQRIADAATKASQQLAQTLCDNIMRASLTRVPLEINPDELLLIMVDFSRNARLEFMRDTLGRIYDAFLERGITRVLILPSTEGARLDASIIKQTDVDASIGANATKTSCECDDTAYSKQ